jgi:hypothetical protein
MKYKHETGVKIYIDNVFMEDRVWPFFAAGNLKSSESPIQTTPVQRTERGSEQALVIATDTHQQTRGPETSTSRPSRAGKSH